jgi:Protein of unknown function (DUF3306)
MADKERTPDPPFLKRWSQRKLAASREPAAPSVTAANTANPPSVAEPATGTAPQTPAESTAPPLPPIDSLSFESDFTRFLQPEVDETLKRQALRKLFADPRFNVMDGLDVYIDDYGKFEPMPPEVLAQLNHAKFLFDPPKTRVNEQGYVEDVPDEPKTVAEASDVAEAPAQIVDNATNTPAADLPVPTEKLPVPPASEES